MTNIYEILKSFGLEIPADKKDEFEKKVLENYKTVSEVDGIKDKLKKAEEARDKYSDDLGQRDKDLADLKQKLEDASGDEGKLNKLQEDFDKLQSTYNTEKTAYEEKLEKQAYEFAIKQKAGELKFSSTSAMRAFIADALDEGLKMKNGEVLGFDDFVKSYKETDADAFLKDSNKKDPDAGDPKPKPQFSGKSTGTDPQPEPEEKPSVTFF